MLQTPRPSVSYGGCGFFGGFYQIGNTAALREYAPYLLQGDILGSSSGSLLAVVIAAGLSIEELTRITIQNSTKVAEKFLGPVTPGFYLNEEIKKAYEDLLPEDIAERISGRLHFSMTKVPQFSNIVVNQFTTKSDLIDALICTSFIPFAFGWVPPKFRGDYCIDGFYSNNQPITNKETITITAFGGNASICPDDPPSATIINRPFYQVGSPYRPNKSIHLVAHHVSWYNACRIPNVAVPPKATTQLKLCKDGYDDAIKYILAKDLIRCNQCSTASSSKPSCGLCEVAKKQSLSGKLPKGVVNVFKDAIDYEGATEKDLSSYLCKLPISMWQRVFKCEF
eukprot:GFUD01018547.1.p1 GENE.GFUD01018547.1~~GFUD01018547.1.p1  ORF type:complete len:339 (+),score=40.17 GFUD01018547.1:27-1043(+)